MNRVITWGSACGLLNYDSDFDPAAQSMGPSQEWGQESKVTSTCLTERLWRQHPGLVVAVLSKGEGTLTASLLSALLIPGCDLVCVFLF